MKTFRQLSPTAAPLAAALSLLLTVGNLRASGPGGFGSAGGTNGTTGAASGGSHGSVSTSGGGRSIGSAPASLGNRGAVSFSNNAPRAQTVTGNFNSARSNESRGVSALNGSMLSPTGNSSRLAAASVPRSTNAWSGTAVNMRGDGTAARSSTGQTFSTNSYYGNRFGRPAAWNGGSDRGGYNRNHDGNRNNRSRYGYPYSNYPYGYGPAYAPYAGYDAAFPYYGSGLYGDVNDGFNGGTPTVNTQYADQGQDAADGQTNPVPQVTAQNRSRDESAQGTIPNNGPDSLVEAVQQELIRRGYFAGKVDAMYGADTKEALRKFQQDHHLADSGLINEATLHALQLD